MNTFILCLISPDMHATGSPFSIEQWEEETVSPDRFPTTRKARCGNRQSTGTIGTFEEVMEIKKIRCCMKEIFL